MRTHYRGEHDHRLREGFSLTEVMVSSFVSSVLIISMVSTVVQLRSTMRSQLLIGEMQQNLRFAMDTVCRDIRSTGYGLDVGQGLLDDWVTWINGFTENPMIVEGTGGGADELVIVGALDQPTTTLASVAAAGADVITVVDASEFNTFDKKIIYIGRVTTARILAIEGNTLTISTHPRTNRGLKHGHPAGTPIELVKEIRYRCYNASEYPHYPYLSRQDAGETYSHAWMQVTAGYIEDFQVSRTGKRLEVTLTGVVAQPDRRFTHPEKGDHLRRETLAAVVMPRKPVGPSS